MFVISSPWQFISEYTLNPKQLYLVSELCARVGEYAYNTIIDKTVS